MSFDDQWSWPDESPITVDRAKELMRGELGRYHYEMLARTCSPLYWHFPDEWGSRPVQANGTLSYVRAEDHIFGITAAHVVTEYLLDARRPDCVLQLGNSRFIADIIDLSEKHDLATLRLSDAVLNAIGKQIMPVSLPRPNDVPQEGRGIMICGYIGEDRRELANQQVEWGMLGVVGIARRVSEDQITWIPEHEHNEPPTDVPPLSRNKDLGGISGGPLIAWFERPESHLSYFNLAGVVKEASAALEYVVATRSHFIRSDGRIEG
jgi:hypothetical protein